MRDLPGPGSNWHPALAGRSLTTGSPREVNDLGFKILSPRAAYQFTKKKKKFGSGESDHVKGLRLKDVKIMSFYLKHSFKNV